MSELTIEEITTDERAWVEAVSRHKYKQQIKAGKATGTVCSHKVHFAWSAARGDFKASGADAPTCPRCNKPMIVVEVVQAEVLAVLETKRRMGNGSSN